MAIFASPEAFYAVMQEMAERMAQDAETVASFRKARIVVRFRGTDPTVEMVLDGSHNPVRALFGPQTVKVDLDLSLTTDLLHELLLERVRIRDAFMAGQIKVSGNVFRAMQLADPLHAVQRIYPQVLTDFGYPL